jgi:hypothetical protein
MNVKKDGSWVIPSLTFQKEWDEVSYSDISQEILARFGLTVTVLRRLRRGADFLVCELEVHSHSPDIKFDARWYDLEAHQKAIEAGAAKNEFLDIWFLDAQKSQNPDARPGWESAGWFKEATDWIDLELGSRNIYKMGPVSQERAGVLTKVLSIPCNTGTVYFKASQGDSPSEVAISEELAKMWPANVTELLVSDAKRNWMLMPDYKSLGYGPVPELKQAEAAQTFAQLLIESKDSMPLWQQLKCPDFGMGQVQAFSENFSARATPFLAGEARLEESELETLVNYVQQWGSMCPQLSDFAIPQTLVNLDFRLANVVSNSDGYLFYDWQESVISHPFFSLLNMFDEITPPDSNDENFSLLESQHALAKEAIRDAYLEAFEEFESKERLLEAFSIASAIQPVVQLKRWVERLERLEPNSFWAKELTFNLILWSKYYISK